MKKFFLMIILMQTFIYSNIIDNICSPEQGLSISPYNDFFSEDLYDSTYKENELTGIYENKKKTITKLFIQYQKENKPKESDDKNTNTKKEAIALNCKTVILRKDFTSNNSHKEVGFYTFLMPNHKYNIKVPKIDRYDTEERKKEYLEQLIQYRNETGNTAIYPNTQNKIKERQKKIKITEGELTTVGEMLANQGEENTGKANQKLPKYRKIIFEEYSKLQEGEKKIYLNNLNMLKNTIEQNFNFKFNSNEVKRKGVMVKKKNLDQILKNQNIEKTSSYKKNQIPNDFIAKCEEETKELAQKSYRKEWNFNGNINVSKYMKKFRSDLDGSVYNTIDDIEELLLYYTSDDFIITKVIDMIMTGIAKAKCSSEKVATEKTGVFLPTSANIAATIHIISNPIIKKACKDNYETPAVAEVADKMTGDFCLFSLNQNCTLEIPKVGYFGSGTGEVEIDTKEKALTECELYLTKIADMAFETCVKETKPRLEADIIEYLDMLNKMIFENLNTKDKCKEKEDILFPLKSEKDHEQNQKETAVAMLNDPNCGIACIKLRENIQSQGISVNPLIKDIMLTKEIGKLSEKERIKIKEILSASQKEITSFDIKMNNFIGKLKNKNRNKENYMWETLYIIKDLYSAIYIEPTIKVREYFSYWYADDTDTGTKEKIIKEFKDYKLDIKKQSYYQQLTEISNGKVFNANIKQAINKRTKEHENKIVNTIKTNIDEIYKLNSFILIYNNLEKYNVITRYNLPIDSVFNQTRIKLIEKMIEANPSIESNKRTDTNKNKEIKFYENSTSSLKKLVIEKIIKNEIENKIKIMIDKGEVNDLLLKQLEIQYIKKIESMVLYRTRIKYGIIGNKISELINQMSEREKQWVELQMYKMYKILK